MAQGTAYSGSATCSNATSIILSSGCATLPNNEGSVLATCVAGNSASNDNSARAAAYAMGGAAAAATAMLFL
ncbi:hypothetical protein EON66_11260 [archaeon]|nr:MAG: hypothetical protein EON66_11260 [archaeon]